MTLRLETTRPETRSLPQSALDGESSASRSRAESTTTVDRDPVEGVLERRVLAEFGSTFGAMAREPKAFHDLMQQVYGAGYDAEGAEGLRRKALAGDFSWLPPIRWSNSTVLGEAGAGAYDAKTGTILLNKDLSNRPALLSDTFLEEVGHHLDTMLRTTDTAGDEGELFRRLMKGERLSAVQTAAIRSENDRGTITIDGHRVEVEFNLFKKIGRAVQGAAKSVGKTLGRAAKVVAKGVKSVAKSVGKGIKRGAKGLGSVVKRIGKALTKIGGPLLKAVDFVSPALLLIPGVGPGLFAAYNIAKTAIAATSGDWKAALFAGLGALSGVGGVAGKVAAMAQKGVRFFDAAKRIASGDAAGVVEALGAAAGLAGGAGFGRVANALEDAARFGHLGVGLANGVKHGDFGQVIGGVAAGASLAGQRGFLDPNVAAQVRQVATLAGRGATAFDALARGDALGALSGLGDAVAQIGPQLGAASVAKLQQIFGYGKVGLAAYDAIRLGDAVALGQLGLATYPGHVMRIVNAGRDLGRATAIGDGAAVLRNVELMIGLGGTTLGRVLGVDPAPLRDAFDRVSPLALRLAEAAATRDPIRLVEAVRNAANAAAFNAATRDRIDAGLGLTLSGMRAFEAIERRDLGALGEALDLPAILGGAESFGRLPSVHFESSSMRAWFERFAARPVNGAPVLPSLFDTLARQPDFAPVISQTTHELTSWIAGGEVIVRSIRDGRRSYAIRELVRVVEENGATLPDAVLGA